MDRLTFWIYQLLIALAKALPTPTLFRLGAALGALGYYIAPGYRQLALRNLSIAFGETKPPAERRRIAREAFSRLVGNLLTSLKIPTMSREEVRSLVELEGIEHLEKLVAEKRGAVVTICHSGNWELYAQLWPLLFNCPLGTIYQRLGNPLIDADVRASRAKMGVLLFERKEGFQGALQVLRNGGHVGVLVDQHAGDAGVWCPFFGRLASTSSLAATLALRTGAALLPSVVSTIGPGRWRVVIEPPLVPASHDAGKVTVQVNEGAERLISRYPEDWFWVHNRWKLPKPKFLLATYKRGIVLPEDNRPLQPFRMVIRSSNWLGDALMTVPAVKAIKRGRPDAHVTVLTPAKLADVWKTVAEVDEVLPIAKGDSVFTVAGKLRGRFEVAILLPNSLRVALESWLAGIPRRVGYPGHRRTWLLNQPFQEKRNKKVRKPEHQVNHYLRLAEFIGADTDDVIEPPRVAKDRALGDAVRIGLCPGAEYGPAKRWLPERYSEVMKRVSEAIRCEWVLVGVMKDAPVGEEILQGFTGEFRNLIGKTSLEELIAELRTFDLLLTNDTGTMHLAAFLGVPTVSIFGSTEPTLTGPLGQGHRVLRHHVECSPCFLRECPLDFRCMKAIEPDEVVAAVQQMLPPYRTNP